MRMPLKNPINKEYTAQSEIISDTILLVEGKDEVIFFEEYFKRLDIKKDIQIINIQGVQNMKTKVKTIINMPNFEQVVSIGIVRDSDGSIAAALQSIKNILREVSLPIPEKHNSFKEDGIKVGIFIMPGDEIAGTMLEDLCLETKKDDINLELINDYLRALEEKGSSYPSNIAKAKCLIYLASTNKVVNEIGLGAKKGYWDFHHPSLNPLRTFIDNL